MKEKPPGCCSLQKTPHWREEKHESSCFAKRRVVASNPFRNMLQQQQSHRGALISCFSFEVWQLGSAKSSLSDSCRQVIDLGLMLLCHIWITSLHIEFLLLFLFFFFFLPPKVCFILLFLYQIIFYC